MKKLNLLIFLFLYTFVQAQPGDLDLTFNPMAGANADVKTSTVQPDGKVLIGGDFTTFNGQTANRIVRLNSDGSIDNTFNTGSGANNRVWNILVQPDGKILVSGDFTQINGVSYNRIARLNSNGSIDNTFQIGSGPSFSSGASTAVYALHLQSDGKILVGGHFSGWSGASRGNITRLNTDGSLDNTFLNGGGGANLRVWSIATQSDGKILIGGWFNTYLGTSRNMIGRLNLDGTFDATFNAGSGANNYIYKVGIDATDRIYIGGDFTTFNGTSVNRVARLTANGPLDGSFNIGSGADNTVWDIELSAMNQVYVGGFFQNFNGLIGRSLVRLNLNGTRDTQFAAGTEFDNQAYTTTIQSDQKIIVGGLFTSYDGVSRPRVLRLFTENSALPVTLLSFDANCNDNNRELIWKTQSEVNNEFYFIERSFDGFNFDKVYAIDGSEFSNQLMVYNWIDELDYSKPIYYKLLQQDLNGVEREIGLTVAECNNQEVDELMVFPNPASGAFTVSGFDHVRVRLKVFNSLGKLVFCDFNYLEGSEINLPVEKGVYFGIVQYELEQKLFQVFISN